MTTYTLVTATSPGGVTILIGSPRDGDMRGIDAAIAGHREMEREYRKEYDADDPQREAVDEAEIELIPGCILTDAEDGDEGVVWCGHEAGWLIDEHGKTFEYAIKR